MCFLEKEGESRYLFTLGDSQPTMPSCSNANCGIRQAILNPGDLCKTCYAVAVDQDPLKDLDLSKPLKNCNLGELVDIFKSLMTPIEQKLEHLARRSSSQDAKISLLEANIKEKDSTIATMTDIIINMQSSLNRIDANTRNDNIIIAGLQEGDIVEEGVGELKDDKAKVKCLLKVMGVGADVQARIQDFEYTRIGQSKENSTRLIKVNVQSKAVRDKILEKSPNLKGKSEFWKKVYVKKDVHPVYSKETSRIYRKMKTLKEENPTKDIKIQDGKLLVDGEMVDKNLFFR